MSRPKIEVNYYEAPQQNSQPNNIQDSSRNTQATSGVSTTIIPIPWIVVGIIALPLLTGYFRPMVFSVPSAPIFINNNNGNGK